MPNYHEFMMRHGSDVLLYLVEQIERVDGVKHNTLMTVEDRWAYLAGNTSFQQKAA